MINKKVMKGKAGKSGAYIVHAEQTILKALGSNPTDFALSLRYSFQDDSNYYLMFQFCSGGDLDFHLNHNPDKRNVWTKARIVFYSAEVISALVHMHKLNILHRDIKPLNILLDTEGHCILSDFGLAAKATKNGKPRKNEYVGTPGYIAPEIIERKEHGPPCDFWSMGCMIYEFYNKRGPFHPEITGSTDVQTSVLNAEPKFPTSDFKIEKAQNITPDGQDLIEKMLVKDPEKRLHKLEDIKKHDFFSEIDWEKMEKKKMEVPWKPDITVNAKGVMEIEECNDDDVYRNITVAAEDVIADFDFVGGKYHRQDLRKVLEKKYKGALDDLPDPAEAPPPAGGCCIIA